MNKKRFLVSTAVIALMLVSLVCVRVGLDGIAHTTPAFHAVDTAAGWTFSILGFVISLVVFVLGGDPSGDGMLFILCGILVSSLVWGLAVEGVAHFMKMKTTTQIVEQHS